VRFDDLVEAVDVIDGDDGVAGRGGVEEERCRDASSMAMLSTTRAASTTSDSVPTQDPQLPTSPGRDAVMVHGWLARPAVPGA
jgi:hypothetical protein